MKLLPLDEMTIDNRLTAWLRDWIAATEDMTTYFWKSAGRRVYARPTRYWLHVAGEDRARSFSAFTDIKALEKAQRFLDSYDPKFHTK